MEDNKPNETPENIEVNETNSTIEEQKYICFKNHCWKMCLGMIVAAFIGGFLAVYFVSDQIMERSVRQYFNVPPHIMEQKFLNDIDKSFRDDMKNIDKIFHKPHKLPKFKNPDIGITPIFMPDSVKVKSEFEDGNFNVTVSLKPFQGDENKINYSVQGRKLTVFGGSLINDGNTSEEIAFSHDFLLPKGADILHIRKYKDGKKLVISVPVREQE